MLEFSKSEQDFDKVRGEGLSLFFGILCIIWGIFILFNSIFKLKKEDYKEKYDVTGGDWSIGSLLLEILFFIMRFLPWWFVKSFVIIIGIAFVYLGFAGILGFSW